MAVLILSFAVSCKKNDGPKNNNPQDTIKPPPKPVVLEDTISRVWIVQDATHNGTTDGGSIGLQLEIMKNGSYVLYQTSYQGTWEFIENKTKVLIDKNEPSYKTTWTIQKLTAKHLDVSFKSPFTGGSVEWKMIPY